MEIFSVLHNRQQQQQKDSFSSNPPHSLSSDSDFHFWNSSGYTVVYANISNWCIRCLLCIYAFCDQRWTIFSHITGHKYVYS